MKINYLAYLDPYSYNGGGELIMRELIEAARARGHDVRVTSKDGGDRHPDPDLWYLSDVYNCPRQQNSSLHPLIDSVVRAQGPYVHHDNAYVDLCWHGALPCNGTGVDGAGCHIKGGSCAVHRARPLYQKALLCSFLSPLHRDVHLQALGAQALPAEKCIMAFPRVNTDKFRNMGMVRNILYLSYGGHGEAKGYHNVMKYFPKGSVIFIGGTGPELLKEGEGHWLGHVEHDKMPILFNQTINYIHVPRWPEPFGLSVAEAALCGCTLIVNDNVGATSWKLNLRDPEIYRNSPDRYWQELEQRINRGRSPVSPV